MPYHMHEVKFDDYSFEHTARVLRKINPYAAKAYKSDKDLILFMQTPHASSDNPDMPCAHWGTLGFHITTFKIHNEKWYALASLSSGMIDLYVTMVENNKAQFERAMKNLNSLNWE